MAWYRSGTVTVANGSSTVTGAGTDFVSNVSLGEAFRGPDGRTYEIAAVVSATELTLAEPYMGGPGGGQTYAIQPTASFTRDLALRAATLLNTFAAVRDGIGQGLLPDGTQAAPALRFLGDQDTGARRHSDNIGALVAGGVDRLLWSAVGIDVSGRIVVAAPDTVGVAQPPLGQLPPGVSAFLTNANRGYGALVGHHGTTGNTWVQAQRIDGEARAYDLLLQPSGGNLLVGVPTGTSHVIDRAAAEQTPILIVSSRQTGVRSAMFYAVTGSDGWAGSGAALYLNAHSGTNRSINAKGTINAGGADYAEYMTKAAGCGLIAKGDVCGVNVDGHLTKVWADARSFVIKSTDPGVVLGDAWGQSVGPRPEGPGEEPAAPIAPPGAPASEAEADMEAWRAIVAAYPAQQAAYQSAHAAWTTAKAAYDTALPAWEAALEVERQKVDRIAFAGQVPVNVSGTFAVGDYIIAAASGAGIKAVAVPEADITFDQYRRRLGKVWAVRDGRAWVDVQHG